MSCQESRQLIEAYVDRELDLVQSLEIERHLESSAGCRAHCDKVEELQSALRTHYPYFAAPEPLEKKIRAQLRVSAGGQTRTARYKTFPAWRLSAVAASIVGLAIFSAIFVAMLRRPFRNEHVSPASCI